MPASTVSFGSTHAPLLQIDQLNGANDDNDGATIASLTFDATRNAPPEEVNKSRLNQIADFFVNLPKNALNCPGKFVAFVQDKLPPRFGGKSNAPAEDNLRNARIFDTASGVGDAALDPYEKNVQILNEMTTTDAKLPPQIANKIALSPTLMAKLENYHKAGWTLQFYPGADMPNTGAGVPEIDETNRCLVFSVDALKTDPDAFLRKFTQIILMNEGSLLKKENEAEQTELNISQEMMDRIEAEWRAVPTLRLTEPLSQPPDTVIPDVENMGTGDRAAVVPEQRDWREEELHSLLGDPEMDARDEDSVFELRQTRGLANAAETMRDPLRPRGVLEGDQHRATRETEMNMDDIEALAVRPRDRDEDVIF